MNCKMTKCHYGLSHTPPSSSQFKGRGSSNCQMGPSLQICSITMKWMSYFLGLICCRRESDMAPSTCLRGSVKLCLLEHNFFLSLVIFPILLCKSFGVVLLNLEKKHEFLSRVKLVKRKLLAILTA